MFEMTGIPTQALFRFLAEHGHVEGAGENTPGGISAARLRALRDQDDECLVS